MDRSRIIVWFAALLGAVQQVPAYNPVEVRRPDEQAALAETAKNGKDEKTRLAAAFRIYDQALLADIAKEALHKDRWIARAAVYRLTDQAALSEIAQRAGTDAGIMVHSMAIHNLTNDTILTELAKSTGDRYALNAVRRKLENPYAYERPQQTDMWGPIFSLTMHPYSITANAQPWPPVLVPEGCGTLLSVGCKVTSSDTDPIIGELEYITDGDKDLDPGTCVELAPGLQWVQIDLGEEKEIHAVYILRCDYGCRVYHDVIIEISNDAAFENGVVTVFNNDHDNSAGRGKGRDKEYPDYKFGRPFPVDAVKGRYVRCYSNGNISNKMSHYTEIEVYGRR